LKNNITITCFEHSRLIINSKRNDNQDGFNQNHLDLLRQYTEKNDFKYFEPIAGGVKFKQFVGVIQVGNLAIEILPKIEKSLSNETKIWRDVLIDMLKECYKIDINTFEEAELKTAKHNLIDIYIELYIKELDKLIRQGLIKKYRKEASNVNAFKGKLVFAKHIKENLVHHERFFTEHQTYDRNHKLHQILSKALVKVAKLSEGKRIFNLCKRVQLNFPEVDDIIITNKLLDEFFKPDRKNSAYTRAYKIARLILKEYAPDISAGREKIFSILFDMNKLWEEFIYLRLKKELSSYYQVLDQKSKSFWGNNQLRPDILVNEKSSGKTIAIIDTKWKVRQNMAPSSADLQQIYAYSKYWQADKVMLLYPSPSDNLSGEFIRFRPICDKDQANCKVGAINILNSENKIRKDLGERLIELLELPVS
jgi:5-methylcytosine-specific restriction enzyme subunit McrC